MEVLGPLHSRGSLLLAFALAASVAGPLASPPAPARAEIVTIGSLSNGPFLTGGVSKVDRTLVNTSLAEPGAQLVSPVDGVIFRFTAATTAGGSYTPRVLRPEGGSLYTAVGSGDAAIPGVLEPTRSAYLPIRAGDTIGLDVGAGAGIGLVQSPLAATASWDPPLAEGSSLPFTGSQAGREFAFRAEILPAPVVEGISRRSGSISGGDRLKILGSDFRQIKSVRFGAAKAPFTVVSKNRLEALTPRALRRSVVPVSVTTVAGTSPATGSTRFAYDACVVPALRSRTLAAATSAIRRADCKVGTVARSGSVRAPRVLAQHPRPGRQLPPGSKVRLTLG